MSTTVDPLSSLGPDHVAAIEQLREVHQRLLDELARIIVGQQKVIDLLAMCLFARGHGLLMGVPGLAIRAKGKVDF